MDGTASSEREAFRGFLATLIGLDREQRLSKLVWQRFPHEIRLLLDNCYVFAPCWQHHNGLGGYDDWQEWRERNRRAINNALAQQDTTTILAILFDRLYMLRNQIVHGGATWNSDVIHDQVRDVAALLGSLLALFIDLMVDNPGHDWTMPHDPVVE